MTFPDSSYVLESRGRIVACTAGIDSELPYPRIVVWILPPVVPFVERFYELPERARTHVKYLLRKINELGRSRRDSTLQTDKKRSDFPRGRSAARGIYEKPESKVFTLKI